MLRKRFTPEQIVNKLREAEVRLSQGATVLAARRALEVSEQTFYGWRKDAGHLKLSQARRLP